MKKLFLICAVTVLGALSASAATNRMSDFPDWDETTLTDILVIARPGVTNYKATIAAIRRKDVETLFNVTAPPYNATGDGATDDTAAIQAAQDAAEAAGGGVLFFPAGDYVSDALTFSANVTFRGAGREITRLTATTASETVFIKSSDETTAIRNVRFEGLEFYCPAAGTAVTNLIRFKNVAYSSIRDCRFNGPDSTSVSGLVIDGNSGTYNSYFSDIEANQFLNLGTGVLLTGKANANYLQNNVFLSNVGTSVIIDDCNNVVVRDSAFQDNTGQIGVQITGGATSIRNVISGNKFEGQLTGVQLETGVAGNVVENNVYSVTTNRYVDNSGVLSNVFRESASASFTDIGQDGQLRRVYNFTADLPTAAAGYVGTIARVLRSAGVYPESLYACVQRLDGGYEWTPVAKQSAFFFLGTNDTTPSVKHGRNFKTASSAATTITTFDDGVNGQEIVVTVADNNTTFDFTGTTLKGNGGVDWLATSGDHLRAVYDGTDWHCEVENKSSLANSANWTALGSTNSTLTGDAYANAGQFTNGVSIVGSGGGRITFTEGAAPSTPASGRAVIYFKTDGKPYALDDAGNEYSLVGGNTNVATFTLDSMTATIETGASQSYWIAPYDGTIVGVWGSVFDPSSSGSVTFDIHLNGTTIMATDKIVVEATEQFSADATTQPTVTTATFSAGDVFTLDIDGAGTDAAAPQVSFGWIRR